MTSSRHPQAVAAAPNTLAHYQRTVERSDGRPDTGQALTRQNVVFLTTVVDLWGRLSNPSEILETIADQGWSGPARPPETVTGPAGGPDSDPAATWPEQRGRLSNPVQRRLSAADIGELCHLYSEGRSIDSLARQYEVNRTTIITHLDRAGIERRRVARKMSDESVARAAKRYSEGAPLAVVANEFDVHARTLAGEFRQAGVSIRPRRSRKSWDGSFSLEPVGATHQVSPDHAAVPFERQVDPDGLLEPRERALRAEAARWRISPGWPTSQRGPDELDAESRSRHPEWSVGNEQGRSHISETDPERLLDGGRITSGSYQGRCGPHTRSSTH